MTQPQEVNIPIPTRIIDVWEDNMFEELERIMSMISIYNYIAMDTEFPGIVHVPRTKTDDYEYQLVKINVDELKLIQLGITLFDSDGVAPAGAWCWQFNFKYDVDNDVSAKDSINILKQAGIKFEQHKTDGIDHMLFAEYFLNSGLVFSKDITWICFQGNQDFGYMYRILANTPIPDSEDGFLDDVKVYFPNLYDIKFMKHEFEQLRGGLSRLGDYLWLDRIGQQHQAGSDSWLTGLAYFKLIETYLRDKDIPKGYNNVLYGMGISINDEQYLDNYTSKTEQLEREAREYQNMNDYYMNEEVDNNNNNNNNWMFNKHYNNYPNSHLMHPSPNMPQHMGYGNSMSMSPNMYNQQDGKEQMKKYDNYMYEQNYGVSPNVYHPGYAMSPNHMEYDNQQVNQHQNYYMQ